MRKPLQLAALLCGCLVTSLLVAAPGKEPGFRFGNNWTVSPAVSVGAFWESNARDTYNDEDSGAGWRVQPVLSISHRLGERTDFGLNAFYTMERGFDSDDAQDNDSYGVNLNLSRKLSKRWGLSVSASYSHSENDEYYGVGWNPSNPYLGRIDTEESDHYNVNAALAYLGNHWNLSIGAGWSRSDTKGGNENDQYNLSLGAGYILSKTLTWTNTLAMTIQDQYRGNDSYSYYLMTGLSKVISDRLSASAQVGVSMQDYDGYKSETSVDPSYTVSVAYKASRKVALALSMNSRYESEYYGDTRDAYIWSHNLTGSVNVQWTDVLSSRLTVSGIYEDHTAPAIDYNDETRTYIQAAFTTSYKFNRYAALYGGVTWTQDEYDYGSGGDETKDNVRLDLGLTFTF